MNKRLTFQQLKQMVGIDDAAYSLGYRLNRKAGVGRYIELVLNDGNAAPLDKIVVRNTADKNSQTFFRPLTDEHGDVIDFIRLNLTSFPDTGSTEWDIIYKVLIRLAGVQTDALGNDTRLRTPDSHHTYPTIPYPTQPHTFDASRYNIAPLTYSSDVAYLMSRGLTIDTIQVFSPFIHLVSKPGDDRVLFGFMYTIPESGQPLGYELRGADGAKLKAAGTDSTNGAWIVDFSGDSSPESKTHVYFAESALDVMALYQLKKAELDISSSVFVSTGGTFSPSQIQSVMSYYSNALAVDCFDNDLAGRILGIRMGALLWDIDIKFKRQDNRVMILLGGVVFNVAEHNLTLTYIRRLAKKRGRITQLKPPTRFKDWNDVLLR